MRRRAGHDAALGFDANRGAAMSPNLADYRVVHFATHGLADSDHPELSGIVLSLLNEKGERQDGFLRLHDIYNLTLPIDLVVLSACSTALGRKSSRRGLIGLVSGLHVRRRPAGGRQPLEGGRPGDERADDRFYRAMFEQSLAPAAALRRRSRSCATSRAGATRSSGPASSSRATVASTAAPRRGRARPRRCGLPRDGLRVTMEPLWLSHGRRPGRQPPLRQ